MVQDGTSTASNSAVFPPGREVLYRTLSCITTFLGLSLITFCFAHRMMELGLFSSVGYRSLTVTKVLTILLLIDSWIFLLSSGILINGLGTSLNARVCDSVMLTCLFIYFLAKGIIYFMLVERLYVVWPNRGTRLSSTVWKVAMLVIPGFFVLTFVILFRRFSMIREDMQCILGLGRQLTITIICYDVLANLLLTGLFLWPLWRHASLSPGLRRVASHTVIATVLCLVMTVSNLIVLTPGHEIAWICLTTCSLDVRYTSQATNDPQPSTSRKGGRISKTYRLESLSGTTRKDGDTKMCSQPIEIGTYSSRPNTSTGPIESTSPRRHEHEERLQGTSRVTMPVFPPLALRRSTGAVLSHLWPSEWIQSSPTNKILEEVEPQEPVEPPLGFADDLDIAATVHSFDEVANDVNGRGV